MHAVQEPGRTIVPTLRYRDVAAAVDWLCTAFGFERHLVVPGEDGAIHYAELTFGDGMIMLGPVQDSAFDKLMTQPADAGGAETQICYLFVADAGEHCAPCQGGRRRDRARHHGGGRRRTRLLVSRPGRAHLEFRHLQSVETPICPS